MNEIGVTTRNIEGSKGDINTMYKLRLTIKDVCHMLSVERGSGNLNNTYK